MHIKSSCLVVTIDGPAGSGKSTVACKLANRLRFVHLNSGALYRAVGRAALSRGIQLSDETAVEQIARELRFQFDVGTDGTTRLLIDGVEAGLELLGERFGEAASRIALHPRVRNILLAVQRDVAREHPVVAEGRDAGTVVFPGSPCKFFLDAPLDVRARRRAAEKMTGGKDFDLLDPGSQFERIEQAREEIRRRDLRDSTREVAPQVRAPDAELVETSGLSADEVAEHLLRLVQSKSSAEQ